MVEKVAEVSLLGKIAGYTEILSKDPRSTVFVPLSEAYRKMKLLDEAIDVANKGVAALPGYAPGFIALARAQAEHGLVKEAVVSFERVLQLEDENLQGIKGLARVRMMVGQVAEARSLLEKAKELAPEDPQIGNMLDSLDHVDSQANPSGDEKSHDREAPIATATLAEIYVRQGLYRKAFNIYRELHHADPGNSLLTSRMDEVKRLIEPEEIGAIGITTQNTDVAAPPENLAISGEGRTAPGSEPLSGEEKALGMLTLWLSVIQRRRENVR